MCDVVSGRATLGPGRPVLFKSTGMAWEDLVVAREIIARRGDNHPGGLAGT